MPKRTFAGKKPLMKNPNIKHAINGAAPVKAQKYAKATSEIFSRYPYSLKQSGRAQIDRINLRKCGIQMARIILINAASKIKANSRKFFMALLEKTQQAMMEAADTKTDASAQISKGDEQIIRMLEGELNAVEIAVEKDYASSGLRKAGVFDMNVKIHTMIHGFETAKQLLKRWKSCSKAEQVLQNQ